MSPLDELAQLRQERDTAVAVAREAVRLMTAEQILEFRERLDARGDVNGSDLGRDDPGADRAATG